ncbi:unnamed protein product, partial [Durusdinium trenchii]
ASQTKSSTMASSDQEWTKVEDMRQSRMGPSGLRGCERHQGEKSSDESMAETEVYVSDEGRWKKASEVFPDHPGARHSCSGLRSMCAEFGGLLLPHADSGERRQLASVRHGREMIGRRVQGPSRSSGLIRAIQGLILVRGLPLEAQ